ncbi:MAG: cell envelope integrity protein TolA [Nitrospirae bacterium]|nr:cell envelope integrity protein TolA [Nitrospirota bacterium]
MKEPSIQTTAILSLVIHIAFLIAASTAIKHTEHLVLPSQYVVSLVSPNIEEAGVQVDNTASLNEVKSPKESTATEIVSKKMKIQDEREKTEQYISDRISAIKAKRKASEIVRLRKIISLKAQSSAGREIREASHAEEGEEDGNILSSYYIKIRDEIKKQWVFAETADEHLEAVISITVMRDGNMKINRIEKSSGNSLFDRSVLKAINKASPVSQPPYEMEIGLRFTP